MSPSAAPVDDRGPGPIATLFPGYFALVMATGIVAIGAQQQSIDWLADSLFAIAAVAYVVLAVLVLTRLGLHTRRFRVDSTDVPAGHDHRRTVSRRRVRRAARSRPDAPGATVRLAIDLRVGIPPLP